MKKEIKFQLVMFLLLLVYIESSISNYNSNIFSIDSRVKSKYYSILYKSLEKKFYIEEAVTYEISSKEINSKKLSQIDNFSNENNKQVDYDSQKSIEEDTKRMNANKRLLKRKHKVNIKERDYNPNDDKSNISASFNSNNSNGNIINSFINESNFALKQYFGLEYSNLLVQGGDISKVRLENDDTLRIATINFNDVIQNRLINKIKNNNDERKNIYASSNHDLKSFNSTDNNITIEDTISHQTSQNNTTDILIKYQYTINKEMKTTSSDDIKDILNKLNLGLLIKEDHPFKLSIDLNFIFDSNYMLQFNKKDKLHTSILNDDTNNTSKDYNLKSTKYDKNNKQLRESTKDNASENNTNFTVSSKSIIDEYNNNNHQNHKSLNNLALCYKDYINNYIILDLQKPIEQAETKNGFSIKFSNITINPSLYQHLYLVSRPNKPFHRLIEKNIMENHNYIYISIISLYIILVFGVVYFMLNKI